MNISRLLIVTYITLICAVCFGSGMSPEKPLVVVPKKESIPKPPPEVKVIPKEKPTKPDKPKRYRVPYDNKKKKPQTDLAEELDPRRKKLRDLMQSVVGEKGTIIIEGKTYPADCSGMVKAIYAAVGIDLFRQHRDFPNSNGVDIIYKTYKKREWNNKNRLPKTGDLMFFNNTYDKNHNSRWGDRLTHISMVEGVEVGQRTVSFIHSGNSGIRRYRLNLDHPKKYMVNGRKMNDFLRRRPSSDQDRTKYMSSTLFYSYIDVIGTSCANSQNAHPTTAKISGANKRKSKAIKLNSKSKFKPEAED